MSNKPTYEELEQRIRELKNEVFERKQAKEALRESESKYRTLCDNANEGILVAQNGVFVFSNQKGEELFGYSQEELASRPFLDFVYEEDREVVWDRHVRRLKGEILVNSYPFRIIHKSGDIKWMELKVSLFSWENKPAALCFMTDISLRMHAEYILREKTHILRERIKELNCLIGISKLIEKPDISLDEIIYDIVELIPPSWHYPEITCSRILLEDKEYETENFKETSWKQSSEILVNGKRKGVLEVCYLKQKPEIDEGPFLKEERALINAITERLGRIIERKRTEDVLNKFFDQALNLHIIAGFDGMIHRVNMGWETILGYKKTELEGRILFDFVHPDDIVSAKEKMARLKKGINSFDFENRYRHKDGSYRLLVWSAIASLEDQMTYAVAIDITEKKEMEGRLQQAQKMESIGDLAGGIAHDFNNILFPIVGMAELLLEDLSPDSLEYQNAKQILKAGKRGSELVQQILAFSRKADHKMVPLRVQQIIKEVLKLSRSTIPSNIEITQDLQGDCGFVMADASQLHQVAMNLITNAYHAVEQKGGNISVRLNEKTLESWDLTDIPLKPGAYVILSVSDTGYGIDPAVMNKIFDPYFTTKEQGKGTGLGLSVVYGIIKEHGGEIKVQSDLGVGTTVDVYLPMLEKSSKAESAKDVEIHPTGSERILLVDDEESIANFEKQMIERLGYQVTLFTSSLDALSAFRGDPDAFDLVVTDMTMPKMTGDQLAKEMISIRKDVAIIICTGFSEKIDREKAKSIGIKDFLKKPASKSDFAKLLRKVLDEAEGNAHVPID